MPHATPLNTESLKRRIMFWKQACPLRIYRIKAGLSVSHAALLLEISIGTVQAIEDGHRSPIMADYWDQLASLIGDGPPETLERRLIDQWEKWLKSRPA